MKVEFAPLNIPLRRRLQTAATLQWVFSFLALAQCCLAAFVLLALSDWWIVALLYAGWLWLDWDTPTCGGRRSQWVRSWSVWDFFKDYFPLTLVKTVDLDPKKNYIFGFHPHGLVSSCKSSLSHLASRPGGGNVAVIAVGGAPEALDARPGALTLQVLNRKGFIKMALKHGAQLVPVFSFGENELFDQMENPSGSPLRKLQNGLQSIMGVAMPLFHARGVFQYSFGLIPYRKPIHTVVGKPIAVVQTPSPSSEDIEMLHRLYMQNLTELFEQHKRNYGVSDEQHLTFI
ncbi:2-acylglycerol O-acyltransferase 1 isoform X2 [Gasterosteus aculeatus]|uniref:2-acylglycerol O-acyltransferase 1 isoform X2 n=1 Tax=Gasterosteus aculeatus aculeatus TaxID=481459 RepID=UPI001A986CB3|nr:2-acylglycerol O-acyltransferase 1 isoform X2 [Gasterosteus aculeatus aculeatus]